MKQRRRSLTSLSSLAPCCPALSVLERTGARCRNALLSCYTKITKKTNYILTFDLPPVIDGISLPSHLRTFSGWALSFQPALDTGVTEEVTAPQSGESVLAGRRPRLEADGAGVAFILVTGRQNC